jgi:hypothetical protein
MVMAAIAAYDLIRRDWRSLSVTVFAGLAGVVVFVLSITVYGIFTGSGLRDALAAFLWRSGQEGSILSQIPNVILQSNGVFAFWFGLGPMALFVIAALALIAKMWRSRAQLELAFLLFIALMLAFYGAMIVPAWGYPRYHTPLVPPAFAIIAFVVAQRAVADPQPVAHRAAETGAGPGIAGQPATRYRRASGAAAAVPV